MSVERGDLNWEGDVRAAYHRLARTPAFTPEDGEYYSEAWAEDHRVFHRALLEGCGRVRMLTPAPRDVVSWSSRVEETVSSGGSRSI
ncbi:hypothetical protein ACFU44_18335 [Nocardia rhizosphaerihabitans]|uniref:hypothetical protein n=1 Tax=Nocardia rhizosphaerihabitans TaxID=1691570 RepID=UPI00366AE64F